MDPIEAEPEPEVDDGAVPAESLEALWDRVDVAAKRVGDGLSATAELIKFFKKRVAAEEALVDGMKKMSVAEGGGLRRGGKSDLMDSLQEHAPSVQQAWANMVWNTQQTCMAHEDLASRMNAELIAPLDEWHREKEASFKKLAAESNKITKELASNRQAVQKTQEKYYTVSRAATEDMMQGSPRSSMAKPPVDDAQLRAGYEATVATANAGVPSLVLSLSSTAFHCPVTAFP